MRNRTPSANVHPRCPRRENTAQRHLHTHLLDCNLGTFCRQNLKVTLFSHRQPPRDFPCKGPRVRKKCCQEKAQGKAGVPCRNHPRLDSKIALCYALLFCSALTAVTSLSFRTVSRHGAPSRPYDPTRCQEAPCRICGVIFMHVTRALCTFGGRYYDLRLPVAVL